MKIYYVTGALVAAALAALIIALPSNRHHSAKVHISPFSLTFQSIVNAYGRAHHQPLISKSTCVAGSNPPGPLETYACAFVFKGLCRMAFIDYRDGEIVVVKHGRVNLPTTRCTIRNAFKQASGG